MRQTIFMLLAVALWLVGAGLLGGATYFAIASFDPPSPDWMGPAVAPFGHPEAQDTPPLHEGDYHVWVRPDVPPCTLEVLSAKGKRLAYADGCSLTLHAHEGDVWTVHATSGAPSSQEYLARVPKLFRPPLDDVAKAGAAILLVGAIFAILAAVTKRAPRS